MSDVKYRSESAAGWHEWKMRRATTKTKWVSTGYTVEVMRRTLATYATWRQTTELLKEHKWSYHRWWWTT